MKKKEARKHILLVEDDELYRDALNDYLAEDYHVLEVDSAEKAFAVLQKNPIDLILLDINLPGMNGIEMLKKAKAAWPNLPVVMLTAVNVIPKVVESMKLGAYDFLTKEIDIEELMLTVSRCLEASELKRELEQRRELQLATNTEYPLVGASRALQKIRKEIQILADSGVTVLIEGETGTGKELVARAIHACSPRASSPFVGLNCGAIPKDLIESELFGYQKGAFTGAQKDKAGKFKLANRGTLLLDEIGELPLEAQVKLLRALEEQEFYPVGGNELVRVDVRIVASTNRDLKAMVEAGSFREDLFFRLNVYKLKIPPLRQRPQDIVSLAEYFMQQFNRQFGKRFCEISKDAQEILLLHAWKGNGRELRNVIERVVLFADDTAIKKEHLYFIEKPAPAKPSDASFRLPETGIDLQELEKSLLEQALKLAKFNKTKAAKLLHLTLPTFYYRLQKYGLS